MKAADETRNQQDSVSMLQKYFPQLTSKQIEQFSSLNKLYEEWNKRINVISRKDIEHLGRRHILHSLAIAKFISFRSGIRVLDIGTGGGFPGIPLAVFFPEVNFHLVDSVGKKIKVVQEVSASVQLRNVSAEKIRAENLKGEFDFIVSRAVAPMKTIYDWTKHLIRTDRGTSGNKINERETGWIFLKGGDLQNEIRELKKPVQQIPITDFFDEEFFRDKFIVFFN